MLLENDKEDKIIDICVAVLIVAALIIVIVASVRHYERHHVSVASVTCPCGVTKVCAYAYCSACGTSSLEGFYSSYDHCADCNSWGNFDKYCRYCGSDNLEEPITGKVKDLHWLDQLSYR